MSETMTAVPPSTSVANPRRTRLIDLLERADGNAAQSAESDAAAVDND
jgi:hypothetical protein